MAPKTRFLSPEPLRAGARVTLSDEESHHLLRVLRMGLDAQVLLIDGQGGYADARVDAATKKSATVIVGEVRREEPRHHVHLVFGVTKAPAMEFILHRATELGVASFQPLYSQHALRLSSWNEDRWRKILWETAKQCEELHLPRLAAPVSLPEWLASRKKDRALYLCDETDRSLSPPASQPTEVEILVGPEGGWSPEEIETLTKAGARKMSLGRNRLRAETASVVAVTLGKRIVGEL